jgi:hypothetical protein
MPNGGALVATDAWKSTFPGAVVGALVMVGVRNPELSAALETQKRELEGGLRARGARLGRDGWTLSPRCAPTSTTTAPTARPIT